MIPKGCDYQGRHPEAAEAATDLGVEDDEPDTSSMRAVLGDVLIACVILGTISVILMQVL